jgi:hypothetical protein
MYIRLRLHFRFAFSESSTKAAEASRDPKIFLSRNESFIYSYQGVEVSDGLTVTCEAPRDSVFTIKSLTLSQWLADLKNGEEVILVNISRSSFLYDKKERFWGGES